MSVPPLPAPLPPLPAPPRAIATSGIGAQQVRQHPQGTTILVFGILGLLLCGLFAPFAWVKGSRAIKEMDAQPNTIWTNEGQARAGRALGIIASCLNLLAVALVALVLVVGITSDTESGPGTSSSCKATVDSAFAAAVAFYSDGTPPTWPRDFSDIVPDYMTPRTGTKVNPDSRSITNGEWTITMRGSASAEPTFTGC